MASSRRNAVRELERLVRLAGHDAESASLGPFVAENAAELARDLDLPVETLAEAAGYEDAHLRSTLSIALRHWNATRGESRRAEVAETAERAAQALGASAVWQDVGVVLPVCLLFGGVLVDATKKYVAFTSEEINVAVYRRTLVDTARVMVKFPDVVCFLDARGLHVRWRKGRGQLNYIPQCISPHEKDLVLQVPIARRAQAEATVDAHPISLTEPVRSVRQPTLFGDIFAALGLG
jgi:hypothetical protein